MIYYDIFIWVIKFIQSVEYDNYDIFHHFNFIFFTKKLLHYFEDYLIDETELRVRVSIHSTNVFIVWLSKARKHVPKQASLHVHVPKMVLLKKNVKDL